MIRWTMSYLTCSGSVAHCTSATSWATTGVVSRHDAGAQVMSVVLLSHELKPDRPLNEVRQIAAALSESWLDNSSPGYSMVGIT